MYRGIGGSPEAMCRGIGRRRIVAGGWVGWAGAEAERHAAWKTGGGAMAAADVEDLPLEALLAPASAFC